MVPFPFNVALVKHDNSFIQSKFDQPGIAYFPSHQFIMIV